jgi:hypothetical protein
MSSPSINVTPLEYETYKVITAPIMKKSSTKRNKEGYQRHNGRWEARYRPQSRYELIHDEVTTNAFKGFKNGLYKYEFLE